MSTWHWIVALVAGFAVVIAMFDPATIHDNKVEKLADDERNWRWIAEQQASGQSANRTNTNLVGIRLVLNRIKMGVWFIVALLVVIAGIEAGKLI